MYAKKYDEEVKDFLPEVTQHIWALLTTVKGVEQRDPTKTDELVIAGISYLTFIVGKHYHAKILGDKGTLELLVQGKLALDIENDLRLQI